MTDKFIKLDRLCVGLKVFIEKYMVKKDLSKPLDVDGVVINFFVKIEEAFGLIYNLEPQIIDEEELKKLWEYKTILLKSLFILTKIDYFVESLTKAGFINSSNNMKEKLHMEFRIKAATDSSKNLDSEKKHFRTASGWEIPNIELFSLQ